MPSNIGASGFNIGASGGGGAFTWSGTLAGTGTLSGTLNLTAAGSGTLAGVGAATASPLFLFALSGTLAGTGEATASATATRWRPFAMENTSVQFTDVNITTPVNIYGLNHDSFTGFVANEHIDHTSVSITGAGILAGQGGDIAASRIFTLNHSDIDHDQTTNVHQDVNTDASPTFANITDSGLTSGRVTYAGASGLLQDSANLTFDGTNLDCAGTGDFGTLTVGSGSITDTSGAISFGNEDLTTTGDVTCGSLDIVDSTTGQTFAFTQDTALSDILAIRPTRTGVSYSIINMYSACADGSQSCIINIFGDGSSHTDTNGETLQIGWLAPASYVVRTFARASGTVRPIVLYTGSNTNQLYLDTDGQVGIGKVPENALDVSGDIVASYGLYGADVEATGHVQSPIIITSKTAITLDVGDTAFDASTGFVVITGDGGGNTIATITGGESGMLLRLLFVDALVTITDTDAHTANTVDLSAAFTSADDTVLTLIHDGTSWYEVSRSVN